MVSTLQMFGGYSCTLSSRQQLLFLIIRLFKRMDASVLALKVPTVVCGTPDLLKPEGQTNSWCNITAASGCSSPPDPHRGPETVTLYPDGVNKIHDKIFIITNFQEESFAKFLLKAMNNRACRNMCTPCLFHELRRDDFSFMQQKQPDSERL